VRQGRRKNQNVFIKDESVKEKVGARDSRKKKRVAEKKGVRGPKKEELNDQWGRGGSEVRQEKRVEDGGH